MCKNILIPHPTRYIVAVWSGSMYGDVYYDLKCEVTTLAEATAAVADIEAAVSAAQPRWARTEPGEVRLVGSEYRGNPVSVAVTYVWRTGDE